MATVTVISDRFAGDVQNVAVVGDIPGLVTLGDYNKITVNGTVVDASYELTDGQLVTFSRSKNYDAA